MTTRHALGGAAVAFAISLVLSWPRGPKCRTCGSRMRLAEKRGTWRERSRLWRWPFQRWVCPVDGKEMTRTVTSAGPSRVKVEEAWKV